MNFEFSEEQEMLRDTARRFLQDNSPPAAVRSVLEGEGHHDAALWDKMAELGWLGTAIPESYGGTGLGYLELCVLAEEMGRALAPVPFASSIYLAAEALMMAGNEAQKRDWLPRLAAGEVIACLADVEGTGGLAARHIKAEVSGGRLTGKKGPVTDGLIAGLALVLARDETGLSLYLADLSGDGVNRTALQTVDPTRPAAGLEFDELPVELLGEKGEGLDLLTRLRDHAAVLMAFEQVGGAEACLSMARDYAMERYAFGRPIASFQAIKHKLADVYVSVELARSNAYFGAWALSTGAAELPVAAATARLAGCRAFHQAAKENIQTHGGMGFTWEFDCHLYYRRSKHLGLAIGAERRWKDLLISRLEQRNAAA